jgi:hypothetical protein
VGPGCNVQGSVANESFSRPYFFSLGTLVERISVSSVERYECVEGCRIAGWLFT